MDSQNDRLVDDANASRCETSGTKGHARRQRQEWKVSAAFSGALLLLGCNGMVPSKAPSYRYKETVVVETPQGIRTGSSVIEVQMAYVNFGDHTNLLPSAFKGQAATIDLPNGNTLFALLISHQHLDWAKTAYQYLIPQQPFRGDMTLGKSPEYRQYQLAMALKGPQVLPRYRKVDGGPGIESAYPWLVTFRNLAEPTSIQEVDADNLAASFGLGYKLKAIILEKTDDPVTVMIERRLDEKFFKKWDYSRKIALKNTINDPYFATLAGKLNGRGFTTNGEFQ